MQSKPWYDLSQKVLMSQRYHFFTVFANRQPPWTLAHCLAKNTPPKRSHSNILFKPQIWAASFLGKVLILKMAYLFIATDECMYSPLQQIRFSKALTNDMFVLHFHISEWLHRSIWAFGAGLCHCLVYTDTAAIAQSSQMHVQSKHSLYWRSGVEKIILFFKQVYDKS